MLSGFDTYSGTLLDSTVVEVGGVVDRVNDNPRRTREGSDLPTWQLILEVGVNTYTFKC